MVLDDTQTGAVRLPDAASGGAPIRRLGIARHQQQPPLQAQRDTRCAGRLDESVVCALDLCGRWSVYTHDIIPEKHRRRKVVLELI